MAKVRKPAKVQTPGSYHHNRVDKKSKKVKKKKVGRPSSETKKKRKGTSRRDYMKGYTPADLERAVDMVQNDEWSVAGAARECNIPRITLLNRIHHKHQSGRPGRATELTKAEEDSLVDVCLVLADYNYPVTKRYLMDMVKSYLDRNRDVPRFKNNKPGRGWIRRFMKRHEGRLVVRKPTNIKRSRAAVSPAQIRESLA